MKIALGAASIAFFLSAPAFATGGYSCRPVSGAGPSLSVVTGHGVAPTAVPAPAALRTADPGDPRATRPLRRRRAARQRAGTRTTGAAPTWRQALGCHTARGGADYEGRAPAAGSRARAHPPRDRDPPP